MWKFYQSRKKENRRMSRERILIENINAKIKVFKIMKYPYRNHRKRHFLRLNFICGIINFEIQSYFPRRSNIPLHQQ